MEFKKNDAQEQPKEPYASPKLIVHGNVEEITKNIGDQGNDGQIGSQPEMK
jgi:hypothetical protein